MILRLLIIIIGCFGVCIAASAADATDAIKRLDKFLEGTHSLRADFHQVIISKSARKAQETSGVMMIQRPGQFRWEVRQPYPQLIIGDGKRIWLYDPELKQVTIKKTDSTLGATPAALLAGDGGTDKLEQLFDLRNGSERAGMVWLEAIPKTTDTGFEQIQIGFYGEDPVAMELTDALSQVTHLRFTSLERNVSLPEDSFHFSPPEGVDIVGEEKSVDASDSKIPK